MIPDMINISAAKLHDRCGMAAMAFPKNTIIVEDRAYFDFLLMLERIKAKNNFFTGVGTGDIQDEFDAFYQADHSELSPKYRIRTHNQYLSYFVTNGILGFLLFLYAVAYPFVRFTKTDLILAIAQFILLFSFLSEDTLESQPGVTLYIFIISLGIVSSNYVNNPSKTLDPLSATEG